MKKVAILFFLISLQIHAQVKNGAWRGVLLIDETKHLELPFNFEIENGKVKKIIKIKNADEVIVVDEVAIKKDSLNFKMPVFDSEFRTKIIGDTLLQGVWINHSRKDHPQIKFTGYFGNYNRFNLVPDKPNLFYNGKWEVTFSSNVEDSTKAIGVFTQINNSSYVKGTFLTETGDYRYLEGVINDRKMYLSCFDGSHAFLFIAENNGSEISNGSFYSGNHWHETWIGKRNEGFNLTDPEQLTSLVNPNSVIEFSFLNLCKKKVSLSDAKYKNKPVIIQIMGSWCPNCLDETSYLSELYKTYNKKGLELIAISFERTTDISKARSNLLRLKKRFNLTYEILVSGTSGKENASLSLPFLNKISAFPTTLILDKNHHVKVIYTGFSGPATGAEYEKFKLRFENIVQQVLK